MKQTYLKKHAQSIDKQAARLHALAHVSPTDSLVALPAGRWEYLDAVNWRGVDPRKCLFVDYSGTKNAHIGGKFLPRHLRHFDKAKRVTGSVAEVAARLADTPIKPGSKKMHRYDAADLDLMGYAVFTKSKSGLSEVRDFIASDLIGPSMRYESKSQTYTIAVTLLCGRDGGCKSDQEREARLSEAIRLGLDERYKKHGVKWHYKCLSSLPYATKSPMRVWVYAIGTNKTLIQKRER